LQVLLWYLGYPDQGLARSQQALTLAQQSAHPHSLGYALSIAATFHQHRREVRAVQECAEAAIRLCTEQGFPHVMVVASFQHGWVLAQQGQAQEGIEQMHQGLIALRGIGHESLRPYHLALLAEAYGTMGQPEAGLTGRVPSGCG